MACGLVGVLLALPLLPGVAAAEAPAGGSLGSVPSGAAANLIAQLDQFQAQFGTLLQGSVSSSVYGTVYGAHSLPSGINYPPAPAGFRDYLGALVGAMSNIAKALPLAATPQSLADLQAYGTTLENLTPDTLNQVYFYLSQSSDWQSYPTLLNSAVATLQSKAPDLTAQFAAWTKANAPEFGPFLLPTSGGGTTGSPPTGTVATLTPTVQGSDSGGGGTGLPPLTPAQTGSDCPLAIPYPYNIYTEHALDIVEEGLEKGAKLAERDDTDGAIALGEGVVITIPGIVHDILEVAAFVVKVVILANTIDQELHSECITDAHRELLKYLYENLSISQGTVISNTNTIITDVVALTELTDARTTVILQDIGYLSQQLSNDVKNILNSQFALVTVMNNQTLQTLENQKTTEAVDNRQLTVEIENSLSGPMEQNVALFELPVTAGGYLDATPVGVKSVVTGLVLGLEETNQAVAPQALLSLSLADRALALGKYKLAYVLYKIAYQMLQYVGPFGPPFGPKFGLPPGPDFSLPFAEPDGGAH